MRARASVEGERPAPVPSGRQAQSCQSGGSLELSSGPWGQLLSPLRRTANRQEPGPGGNREDSRGPLFHFSYEGSGGRSSSNHGTRVHRSFHHPRSDGCSSHCSPASGVRLCHETTSLLGLSFQHTVIQACFTRASPSSLHGSRMHLHCESRGEEEEEEEEVTAALWPQAALLAPACPYVEP